MNLRKETKFYPAFDRTHSDPSKNYGIGCARFVFALVGDEGAISFTVRTGWYLPQNFRDGEGKCDPFCFNKADGSDISFHVRAPRYESHIPVKECVWLDGADCYADGSSLCARDVFETLVSKGLDAMWEHMEQFYRDWILERGDEVAS